MRCNSDVHTHITAFMQEVAKAGDIPRTDTREYIIIAVFLTTIQQQCQCECQPDRVKKTKLKKSKAT